MIVSKGFVRSRVERTYILLIGWGRNLKTQLEEHSVGKSYDTQLRKPMMYSWKHPESTVRKTANAQLQKSVRNYTQPKKRKMSRNLLALSFVSSFFVGKGLSLSPFSRIFFVLVL